MRSLGALAVIVAGSVIASSSPAIAKPRVTCPPGKPPDWAQAYSSEAWLPDSGAFGDWYPAATGLEPGSVTLSCVAGADGRLYDCEVVDEKPPSGGLGLWAMHVSHDMRLKRPGCPPDGARFNIALHFDRAD